jgi:AraC-like DNA-binding protein
MPSSAVRTFTDPDDYAASIRQGNVELTVVNRGRFDAKLTRIDLHRLWMQRFSESTARVCHVAGWGGRSSIAFLSEPGPTLLWAGMEIHATEVLRLGNDQSYHQRIDGPSAFASMSLPVDDMVSWGAEMAGLDLAPLRDGLAYRPAARAIDRLRRLHAAVGRIAEEAPEIVANAHAAHGLEQALIEAMLDCLNNRPAYQDSAAQGQHALVMRRFRRLMEENPERALYLPEICKAIGVSERTLRVCCHEHLAMGPKRYLILRRLHLARRALQQASEAEMTVTEVAMRFGFWQLGRFAVEYRSLFDEAPSATLRRLPE